MTEPNSQAIFLRSQARACNTYLRIASTASNESHRQQALFNALEAYARLRAHLPKADLTEKDRCWFNDWIKLTTEELRFVLS